MAGNLALVESSPEIGFLLKQTNHAAGEKLFIWLPVEEPHKNTIQSAVVGEVRVVYTENRIILPHLVLKQAFKCSEN